jgi:hypothetical protein
MYWDHKDNQVQMIDFIPGSEEFLGPSSEATKSRNFCTSISLKTDSNFKKPWIESKITLSGNKLNAVID